MWKARPVLCLYGNVQGQCGAALTEDRSGRGSLEAGECNGV